MKESTVGDTPAPGQPRHALSGKLLRFAENRRRTERSLELVSETENTEGIDVLLRGGEVERC